MRYVNELRAHAKAFRIEWGTGLRGNSGQRRNGALTSYDGSAGLIDDDNLAEKMNRGVTPWAVSSGYSPQISIAIWEISINPAFVYLDIFAK